MEEQLWLLYILATRKVQHKFHNMCVCSVQGLQQETKNMEMHRKDTYTYVLNKTVQKSEQYTWVV